MNNDNNNNLVWTLVLDSLFTSNSTTISIDGNYLIQSCKLTISFNKRDRVETLVDFTYDTKLLTMPQYIATHSTPFYPGINQNTVSEQKKQCYELALLLDTYIKVTCGYSMCFVSKLFYNHIQSISLWNSIREKLVEMKVPWVVKNPFTTTTSSMYLFILVKQASYDYHSFVSSEQEKSTQYTKRLQDQVDERIRKLEAQVGERVRKRKFENTKTSRKNRKCSVCSDEMHDKRHHD